MTVATTYTRASNQNVEQALVAPDAIEVADRFRKDQGDLGPLVDDIKRNGLINPIAVFRDGADKYSLIAGSRRLAACKLSGLEKVPIRIYQSNLRPVELRSIELSENIQRKDMTWQEEVALKQELHKLQMEIHGPKAAANDPNDPGWTKSKTAELLGEDKSTTHGDLLLAKAMNAVPELARCKNKSDAIKLVKKLGRTIHTKQKTETLQANESKKPDIVRKQELASRYIVGDFIIRAQELESKSVGFIELDPPYAIDLGANRSTIGSTMYYNEVAHEDYPKFLVDVFKECYRVLKDNTFMVVWFALDPWYRIVADLLQAVGFTVSRAPAVWTKNIGQCMSPKYILGSNWEPFFYARKGSPEVIKQGRSNVFAFQNVLVQKRIHPTERPIEMIEEVLRTFVAPGTPILCPFLGSGNTILAADNLGYPCFGYDLSEEFHDAFVARVSEGTPGNFKSYEGSVSSSLGNPTQLLMPGTQKAKPALDAKTAADRGTDLPFHWEEKKDDANRPS